MPKNRESKEFSELTVFVFNHKKDEYLIKYSSGKTITALFEAAYEDDNGYSLAKQRFVPLFRIR